MNGYKYHSDSKVRTPIELFLVKKNFDKQQLAPSSVSFKINLIKVFTIHLLYMIQA